MSIEMRKSGCFYLTRTSMVLLVLLNISEGLLWTEGHGLSEEGTGGGTQTEH